MIRRTVAPARTAWGISGYLIHYLEEVSELACGAPELTSTV